MASTSNSIIISGEQCDVFLNFCGQDTRHNIADFLYEKLEAAGIHTFKDDEKLEKGIMIGKILGVIGDSKICIPIFSKNYSSREWCLTELEEMFRLGKTIIPIFYDVKPSDVRELSGEFGHLLQIHCSRDIDPLKADRWRSALRKAASINGWDFEKDFERHQGKLVDAIVQTVSRKLNMANFTKHPGKLLLTEIVGSAIRKDTSVILESLRKDDVRVFGIYGMGGVGKTTLALNVHDQLIAGRRGTRQGVYWVTASQSCSIKHLQGKLAVEVGIVLLSEDDEIKRAAQLSKALENREEVVLFLDDVWNDFPLERLGLSQTVTPRWKLIVISRSLEICRRMGYDEYLKVDPLHEKESWDLFNRKVGTFRTIPDSGEIHEIARAINRECAGLPLATIAMASSLRHVDDVSEWRDALGMLKGAKQGLESLDERVFKILEVSYDRLNDIQLQLCFLYCAVYPGDYMIEREGLINLFIDVGLISGHSRCAEFDKGHTILNRLEYASLLEGTTFNEAKYVKMHDLIRDVALRITKPTFMVKAGQYQQNHLCMPHIKDEWKDGLEVVSLMWNEMKGVVLVPHGHNLSTLLLNHNYFLSIIIDSFFVDMPRLTVLDLSGTAIVKLPNSVSELVKLTALILKFCSCLVSLPSLAKLQELRKLDLESTAIEELPHGMEMLVCLRYLNLRCSRLKTLRPGILPQLYCLRHFEIIWPPNDPTTLLNKELADLEELEVFRVAFNWPNYRIFSEKGVKRCRYHALLGDSKFPASFLTGEERRSDRLLEMKNVVIPKADSLVLPTDIEALYMCSTEFEARPLVHSLLSPLKPISQLKRLSINSCDNILKLLKSDHHACLPSLEELIVTNCSRLQEIIATEEDGQEETSEIETRSTQCDAIILPKLRHFRLCGLPSLTYISKKLMACDSLEELEIIGCRALKKIPLALKSINGELSPRSSLRTITIRAVRPWDSLEWNSPDAKNALKQFLKR